MGGCHLAPPRSDVADNRRTEAHLGTKRRENAWASTGSARMNERESAAKTRDYQQSGLPGSEAFSVDHEKRHAPRSLRWTGLLILFCIGAAMLIAGIVLG